MKSLSGVKKVGDIVAEIASASAEQSQGIEQVNQAVAQMDEITQQNAALAEQASAASVSMSDQSTSMSQILAFFNAGGKGRMTAVIKPTAQIENAAPQAPTKPAASNNSMSSSTGNDEWEEF